MFVSPKKFSNRLNVEVIIITSETTEGLYHILDFKSWLASFIERTPFVLYKKKLYWCGSYMNIIVLLTQVVLSGMSLCQHMPACLSIDWTAAVIFVFVLELTHSVYNVEL